MLRAVVLAFACLVVALGAFLCTIGVGGGVPTLLGGLLILFGTLFERWRYRNRNASVDGDWHVTGERFVDPQSGRNMEVLYDPNTGERRYREMS